MSSPQVDPRHFIRLADLPLDEVHGILQIASELKLSGREAKLDGRSVGMLFFRGSLRTRTSFEAALQQLGGHGINLSASADFWELEDREGSAMDGRAKEHVKDAARVLSGYVDALAIRPAPEGHSWPNDRKDAQILAWAQFARVPVINMESALWHPLQALADLLTMRETLGELRGKRLAISWVHSPEPTTPSVTHSLLCAAAREGMTISVAHPPGYELDPQVLAEARELGQANGGEVFAGLEQPAAVEGAHVVYARSWLSLEDYGNPTLAASRRARFMDWRVDERTMELGSEARFMHAMPIRRNVEVSDAVLDGKNSLVYDQAENRLHTQKALLRHLLG